MNKIGVIYTIISGMLFGVNPLIVTIAYNYGYDALSIGFYRYLLAIPVLLILCKLKKVILRVEKMDVTKMLLIGIFGMSMTSLFLSLSYKYLSVGLATTLHFLYPMFVTVISILLFKEKVVLGKIVCILMSFIGMILIADADNTINIWGVFLSILSGITYAIYLVSIERTNIMKKYNSLFVSLCISSISAVFFFFMMCLFQKVRIPNTINEIVVLICIAVLCQVIAVVSLQLGIKYIGSTNAAVFSVFEPLTSNVVGCIFLKETLTLKKAEGCILILLAVVLMSYISLKSERCNKHN